MSLVEEFLAQHFIPERNKNAASEGWRHICACGDIFPCKQYRLATELQNAQAVVEVARKVSEARAKHFVASCVHDGYHPEISEAYQLIQDAENEIDSALARYDEGRKA